MDALMVERSGTASMHIAMHALRLLEAPLLARLPDKPFLAHEATDIKWVELLLPASQDVAVYETWVTEVLRPAVEAILASLPPTLRAIAWQPAPTIWVPECESVRRGGVACRVVVEYNREYHGPVATLSVGYVA